MKKIISALILVSFLALPVIGLAAAPPDTAPEIDVMDSLANITNWLFAILILIAAMFLVVAGIQYISAQGDPEKIKAAHQKVLYSLIGVVVALLAKGLVTLIEKVVTPAP